MSTHAALGILYPTGRISGCYVHYDGETMKPRIEDYIRRNTTTGLAMVISRGQQTGGIRSFHCPPFIFFNAKDDIDYETDFLDDNEAYIIDATNWDDDHMGACYSYLVDYETGEVTKTSR